MSILKRDREKDIILGSEVLRAEILRLPDVDKRDKVQELYVTVDEEVTFDAGVKDRASQIQVQANIKAMDSFHIASAEKGRADVFLTTDDRLIKSCKRLRLDLRVMNPVTYLAEVIEDA